MMFHYLLEENNLRPVFEKEGLSATDITFIEEQVAGPKKNYEPGVRGYFDVSDNIYLFYDNNV